MSLPELTAEELRRWEARFQHYIREGKIDPSRCPPTMIPRDIFFAGEWLGEQLIAHGFSEGDASDICFANGQMVAAGGEPWETAQRVLADAFAGNPPRPGPELAERLTRGRSIAALLNPAIERGVTPEEMERNIDCWRQRPRYPREEPQGRHAELFRALQNAGTFPEPVIQRFLAEYRRLWEEKRR